MGSLGSLGSLCSGHKVRVCKRLMRFTHLFYMIRRVLIQRGKGETWAKGCGKARESGRLRFKTVLAMGLH